MHLWEEWRTLKSLTQLYRRLAPDLIHHATIKPVIYGTMAASRAGRPAVVNAITGLGYIYTGSGWRVKCLRFGVNAAYRCALRYSYQRVIFQNNSDLEFISHAAGLDPKRAVLIPGSGVDVDYFSTSLEPGGEPVVVMPARIIRDKGVEEFVAAARAVRDFGINARFVLVGGLDNGNPTSIAESEVRKWVDEGVVEWMGQVDDMRAVYQSAHIVVLPSYREGLPKVILEAGASGRPVIATDAPGCRDAVVDGETGYIVPVRDHVALAKRIHQLLSDAGLRRRMGTAGRALVETEFSSHRVVEDTLAVYRSLLGKAKECN